MSKKLKEYRGKKKVGTLPVKTTTVTEGTVTKRDDYFLNISKTTSFNEHWEEKKSFGQKVRQSNVLSFPLVRVPVFLLLALLMFTSGMISYFNDNIEYFGTYTMVSDGMGGTVEGFAPYQEITGDAALLRYMQDRRIETIDTVTYNDLTYRDIFGDSLFGTGKTNLIDNGDMNSLDNWKNGFVNNSLITLYNNKLKIEAITENGYYGYQKVTQTVYTPILNHNYYISFDWESNYNTQAGFTLYQSSQIKYYSNVTPYSYIYYNDVLVYDRLSFYYYMSSSSFNVGDYILMDNVLVYDLTDIFGVGQEPILEEFESMLDIYKDMQENNGVYSLDPQIETLGLSDVLDSYDSETFVYEDFYFYDVDNYESLGTRGLRSFLVTVSLFDTWTDALEFVTGDMLEGISNELSIDLVESYEGNYEDWNEDGQIGWFESLLQDIAQLNIYGN